MISLFLLIMHIHLLRFYRKNYHYEFFLKDLDVGTLYLSTKFELNWFTNNGNLSSDKITGIAHRPTHTETESDTHPIWDRKEVGRLE